MCSLYRVQYYSLLCANGSLSIVRQSNNKKKKKSHVWNKISAKLIDRANDDCNEKCCSTCLKCVLKKVHRQRPIVALLPCQYRAQPFAKRNDDFDLFDGFAEVQFQPLFISFRMVFDFFCPHLWCVPIFRFGFIFF